MFAVLIAGSIGYVLSGWAGMAVGATVATVVAVLTENPHPRRRSSRAHHMSVGMRAIWHYPSAIRSARGKLAAAKPTESAEHGCRPWSLPVRQPAVAGPAPADPVPVALVEPEPVAPLPDHSRQRQLPTGSKAPGRSARAQTPKRSPAVAPSASGEFGHIAPSEGKRPHTSEPLRRRLGRVAILGPRSQLAKPFETSGLGPLPRMPYRFDRIRRLR